MKKIKVVFSTTAAVAVLAGAALIVNAYAGQKGANRVGTLTPWKAMELAEKKTGGRAVEAVYEYDDGAWGYAVYVVANHKLWEVELSKDSGKVGDVETADPAGEAKELEGDLKRAMR